MRADICFDDVRAGMVLGQLTKQPTNVQLFRFSAVTWNAHRIHFDQAYAEHEGYPAVLVQSHLHGCFLLQVVTDWAGLRSRVRSFSWRNRNPATPMDVLACSGSVLEVSPEDACVLVGLEERNQDGVVCATGRSVVRLPRRCELLKDDARG